MKLLITQAHPSVMRRQHPLLGRLIQPRDCGNVADTAAAGVTWAADNDAFNGWSDEAEARYRRMLDGMVGVPDCKFVTLPDVVGDARATAVRFNEWWQPVTDRGLPPALVLQDGIEELGVPWDKISAVFIGGSTEFKLGDVAAEYAGEARARGLWVHMGRVNSLKRIRYAQDIGCHSVDGSQFSMFSDTWVPWALRWLEQDRLPL